MTLLNVLSQFDATKNFAWIFACVFAWVFARVFACVFAPCTLFKKIRDFLHEVFREYFFPDYELASGQFRPTPRYQS